MNKQDLIYKIIRKNVVKRMFNYIDDSDYVDDVVDYIIEVTNIYELIEALRYISLSRMWDTDENYNINEGHSSKYWHEKTRILQDKAEDAMLALYGSE